MISGTLLRVWTNSCTATAITSKRIMSKTLFIGITACNESFPQTASYHKTSQRSDDDPKFTAVKEAEIEIDNSVVVTRTKIAEIIAHDYDISRSKAERIIGRIFHEISQNLVDGKKVSISGFGSFTTVEVKERTIRHPQTGDLVSIPSRFKAKFSSFRALKETINPEKLTS